jgi:tetratricopeptide (TPR) repeat protein
LYESQGRYGEAEALYTRALAIRERQLEAEHPDTAQSVWWLAGLAVQQHHVQEAKVLYQRALSIFERTLGSEHPTTQHIQQFYASILKSLTQDDETLL